MVSNYLPLPHAPLPSITYPFWRLLGRLEKFVLSVLNINSSGVFCLPPTPSPGDGINWELIDGFSLTNIDILNNWKRKMCYGDGFGGRGGGGLLGILCWVVPPNFPNPDPISDKKNVIFHTRFQIRLLKSIPVLQSIFSVMMTWFLPKGQVRLQNSRVFPQNQ